MSRHDRILDGAAAPVDRAGAGVVSTLGALAPAEARFVMALRLWLDGAQGQATVWNGIAAALGPRRGRAALMAFESLLNVAANGARGVLWRRPSGCPQLCRDEAALAAVIRCAGAGDLPGAIAMATEVVRPRDAADLARAAGALAPALLAMSEVTARRNGPFRRVVAPADRRAAAAAPCRSGVGPVSRTLH